MCCFSTAPAGSAVLSTKEIIVIAGVACAVAFVLIIAVLICKIQPCSTPDIRKEPLIPETITSTDTLAELLAEGTGSGSGTHLKLHFKSHFVVLAKSCMLFMLHL